MNKLEIRTPDRGSSSIEEFDDAWVAKHLADERRRADLLGEVRETIFGMQDGLISTLAVVSTVSGATGQSFPILVAGLASGLAGVFSMAVGEYVSSKSQREIFEAQIAGEEKEVAERPAEARAEVAFLLQAEGLDRETAFSVVQALATNKRVLLKTMVEKELGLIEGESNAARGALIMGTAFGFGSAVPVLPFLFLPVAIATPIAVVVTALALFAMGGIKSRWTRRNWFVSGAEIVVMGALAGGAGYLFGTVLPGLLGVVGITV